MFSLLIPLERTGHPSSNAARVRAAGQSAQWLVGGLDTRKEPMRSTVQTITWLLCFVAVATGSYVGGHGCWPGWGIAALGFVVGTVAVVRWEE
jgi:fatty acid desaturase